MRLPFPDRVTLWRVGVFATMVCIVQQLYGTALSFSILSFAYIMLSAVAFNLAGGLLHPSGAYVFFNSLFGVTVGLVMKDILGEAADTNLQSPTHTMAVYTFGMFTMLIAVFVSRRFARKKGYLQDLVVGENLRRSALGCLVGGILFQFFGFLLGSGNGSIGSALNQLNRLIPMAIILGVTYEIKASGGRRSLNSTVLIAGGWLFLFGGIFGFSKEGLFLPFAAWALPAAALRFRLPNYQIVIGVVGMWFMLHYMVPYSQYGRGGRGEIYSFSTAVDVSWRYLSNLEETRRLYLEDQKNNQTDDPNTTHYFNKEQGVFDRLNIIPIDDALMTYTDENQPFGLYPTYVNFANIIPHILWPGKPSFGQGNTYAHEIGVLGPDDYTTGISFSPTADAYHQAKWLGVAFIAPISWFLFFIISDSVAGNVSKSPWGLLLFVLMSHQASEGLLAGAFYQMTYGSMIMIFCAFFSAYVTPVLGSLIIGSEKTRVRRVAPIRSIPRRSVPLPPSSELLVNDSGKTT